MEFLKILIILSLLNSVAYASNDCKISFCSSSTFPIRFPFALISEPPQDCMYPGFNLRCSFEGLPILDLPNSGEYFVRDIDYLTQEIQLYDTYNCLPRRLMELNLSSSPFMAGYNQNYTFLRCPTELVRSRFTTVECLSNSTVSVLAASSMSFVKAMNMCNIIDNFTIPVSWQADSEVGLSSSLHGDLLLTWTVPNCEDCEGKGSICGMEKSESNNSIVCLDPPGKVKGGGLQVFRIIALSIVVPAVVCSVALSCFMCLLDRGRFRIVSGTSQNLATATITPQIDTGPEGLDDSTIESYKKMVLGESRRIPGPNDFTCPICLAEYHPKETLRCLPDCEHCFHAECIDEWLRMNGTCPVCRHSPSPVHVTSLSAS
ncbi:hypothetical protein Leryth_018979 [Lithospermum erythrorhizon]|nr:hypothetical protein Leryth_018979 [Lithospermum erythrorhizon]